MKNNPIDCLIVGAGVIGLSLAYELARQGRKVRLLDRGKVGNEASWAGAGMLPPAGHHPENSAVEQLEALSNRLHPEWSQRLLTEVGIDNGYRNSGALYLACDDTAEIQLGQYQQRWQTQGVPHSVLASTSELHALEPELQLSSGCRGAVYSPEESQIRNPRHLKALLAACIRSGVEVCPGVEVIDFRLKADRIETVETTQGRVIADQVCVTAGAFGRGLTARLGCELAIQPVRGQIILLTTPVPQLQHIVNVGKRYLVPRNDGRLLVGSTEEHVGFNREPTIGALSELLGFALELVPSLRNATLERQWLGFRPGTPDGLPYLGRIPDLQNAFIAIGHYRSGIQLSTGTAQVMTQLMLGQPLSVDLQSLSVQRS